MGQDDGSHHPYQQPVAQPQVQHPRSQGSHSFHTDPPTCSIGRPKLSFSAAHIITSNNRTCKSRLIWKALTSWNHCQDLAGCARGTRPSHRSVACMLKCCFGKVSVRRAAQPVRVSSSGCWRRSHPTDLAATRGCKCSPGTVSAAWMARDKEAPS